MESPGLLAAMQVTLGAVIPDELNVHQFGGLVDQGDNQTRIREVLAPLADQGAVNRPVGPAQAFVYQIGGLARLTASHDGSGAAGSLLALLFAPFAILVCLGLLLLADTFTFGGIQSTSR